MVRLLWIGLIFISSGLLAQDPDTTYWRISFDGSLPFNQASFSDNWTGGGINSLGLSASIIFKAKYQKGKHSWDNDLDFLYGFTNNDGQGFRKNNDRIYIDTKYGYSIAPKWNVFGSFNILSQFDKGYRYEEDSIGREQEFLISDFLAPGYFTFATGFEYKPTSFFALRVSPFAPRLTVVKNDEVSLNVDNNYGVEIGETTRWEVAAFQLLADFDKDLSSNLNLKFKYIMYMNYETLDSFKFVDHRLEAVLTAKVAKYFEVILGGTILYDFDQVDEVQFNQVFGLGFAYSFKNFTPDE